jgi:hypothetical protein
MDGSIDVSRLPAGSGAKFLARQMCKTGFCQHATQRISPRNEQHPDTLLHGRDSTQAGKDHRSLRRKPYSGYR